MRSSFEDLRLLQKEGRDSAGDSSQLNAPKPSFVVCHFGVAVTEDDGESGRNLLLWIHRDGYLFVQEGFEGG